MKKKLALTMCVCGVCLMTVSGCGNKETNISSVDVVEALDEQETANSPETKDVSEEEVSEPKIDTSKFTDEMCCDVMEIISAEKTVVASRLYVDGDTLISPVEGNEELVSVYFTDDAKYVLETGKADGSDVTRQEADFSTIQEGDTLNLKGMENTVGTEFLATEAEIIRVID